MEYIENTYNIQPSNCISKHLKNIFSLVKTKELKKLFIENTILINAPISVVWNELANPGETKKYMFGCEAVSDWKPGSELLWRGK